MAERSTKRPRVTPRNSEAVEVQQAVTPFADLHQLGQIANTNIAHQNEGDSTIHGKLHQLGQTLNPPNPSSERDTIKTPARNPLRNGANHNSSRGTTPGTGAKATPSGRLPFRSTPGRKPTTPHGVRAQQQSNNLRKYAGATPGRKDRRQSGRTLRETPRNELRMLSRALAAKSAPIAHTPIVPSSRRRSQLPSESPSPEAPTMTLGMADMEYDSFHEAPPRMSIALDDADMEAGRRQYNRRRSSFDARRMSDQMGVLGDIRSDQTDAEGFMDSMMGFLDTDGPPGDLDESELIDNGTTGNLRALMRREEEGDLSITRQSLGTDGDPTFQFDIGGGPRSSFGAPEVYEEDDEQTAELDMPIYVDEAEGGELGAEDEVEEEDEEAAAGFNGVSGPGLFIDDQAEDLDDVEVEDAEIEAEAMDAEDMEVEEEQGVSPEDSHHPVPSPPVIAKVQANIKRQLKPKVRHTSRLGNEYPSLPANVIKKLASTFSKQSGGNGKINKDTVTALTEASDWFFERLSEDLATYSTHARRKTIEEADVVTLMKRQRQLNDHNTVFSIAQKYLPGELLQSVRMAPTKLPRGKKRRLSVIDEEE
ncbi:hypothetical protein BT63DRAFT_450144 [Microthyrium microscopicum]|uniref:CENP-T/Histone H4 histone fold domain-containing protein n=1 Tax=Microthyrium microscopicum TaxID=703497 RepID=A0A6A6UUR4_9PEZI|nr:hypothetical protein BT63DRAFT_450144 [Microthyrium microscopicum]